MSEQEDFFSPKHKRLLSIATWAKYLAWIVLIICILQSGMVVFRKQVSFRQTQAAIGSPVTKQDYWHMVADEPIYYGLEIVSDMIAFLLQGAVYYVILKGISLGLNMIVETDIDYREAESRGGQQ